MVSGKLSIVATPIGNLQDITLRAIDTLRQADVILCEDTRVTRKMLQFFDIQKKTLSYHHHSDGKTWKAIEELLVNGKHLALVTDAGTPGVSDPGNELIARCVAHIPGVRIEPIPGPSAVVAAISVAGFKSSSFLFLGFPPHKKRRKAFFDTVAQSPYTVVFYESPHRIEKALSALSLLLDPNRKICVCRELTKKFEQIYRGTISEIQQQQITIKGEFVVVCESIK
ncbi:MAG: 16S rRNA (cytidine(1402)-2'-O)-methyltransferase [Candidatus Magasanikbacteria bacterium]|nr:16S rRNA (cytidine(1402)-2'-O)-methyltransferase [Candidatus Magasanikbacteria bacterium]MBT5262594.1 16S rRNA (cytidine(1402)-2'-O)-methyltransferase [Candidatus Magasanikbacteria bacterium]MBT5819921.1 16S rRNA (cytidine(1402)-2'-O)-methyltransferase [Candidatus Magasanikbacteria bacterium]